MPTRAARLWKKDDSTSEDVEVTSRRALPGTAGGIFNHDEAIRLHDAEGVHWWFRSKASFVAQALRRFPPSPGWLVDVGAGGAGITERLGWSLGNTLAVEGNAALAREATARHSIRVVQADVRDLPLVDDCAAVVCPLDVLEHLSDPQQAVAEAYRILQPGGRLIVTVPAHPWLWSAMDEVIGHMRRYTRSLVRTELERQGLDVLWISHVFSWLVVPVWAKRQARPGIPEFGLDATSSLIDRLASVLTRVEELALDRTQLRFGTSILCVAERRYSRLPELRLSRTSERPLASLPSLSSPGSRCRSAHSRASQTDP